MRNWILVALFLLPSPAMANAWEWAISGDGEAKIEVSPPATLANKQGRGLQWLANGRIVAVRYQTAEGIDTQQLATDCNGHYVKIVDGRIDDEVRQVDPDTLASYAVFIACR